MKIGILTWYFGVNYGARAHSLALMRILEERGHQVVFLNYHPDGLMKEQIMMSCQFEHRHRHPICMGRGLVKYGRFCLQLRDYPQTQRLDSLSEVGKLGLDLVILGSDEIINLNHKLYSDSYFGVGLPEGVPALMFSASSGTVECTRVLPEKVRSALMGLKAVSVRDNATLEFLRRNGRMDVCEVLDPTLLYDFCGMEKGGRTEPYLLIYSFGALKEYAEEVRRYAHAHGLKIYAVGQISQWADRSFMNVSLYEWLGLYRNASCILTDSYHGLIFALKYHKELLLVKKDDKANKIDGLLQLLGVGRGYLMPTTNVDHYCAEPLNYAKIDEVMTQNQAYTISFLDNALKHIKDGEKET